VTSTITIGTPFFVSFCQVFPSLSSCPNFVSTLRALRRQNSPKNRRLLAHMISASPKH
jgi:hypothetical protein